MREEYRASQITSVRAFSRYRNEVWKTALDSAVLRCKLKGGSAIVFTSRYHAILPDIPDEVHLIIILDAERGELCKSD